ncbi:hypothetical protein N0V93_003532 [Gnomoniopsis smithogilvyi]|uniref:DUF7580 domain-containing protein n=1 Tax=Gnomoniopsis smithogilvyi TaxID=1191159 RepID=A0A9W9CYQ3_9PEZI|nr:hypothetical protein N0V93_003532 [Gnomoniopsis smithogilvyi]
MSTESDIRERANAILRDHFNRDRANDYDRVKVLLLYWEVSDMPGCKDEANALAQLFTRRFNYQVQHWAIPPKNSQLLLDRTIANLLATILEPRSLAIIHYGGHGDADDDKNVSSGLREKKSVWASHGGVNAHRASTLSWSKVQEKLADVNSDILLILDCCFAAQNIRSSARVLPPNVELLAACSMRVSTLQPGPYSFTTTIVREIQSIIDEMRPIIIKELYSVLGRQDRNLSQTPIYHPLHANRSIRLDGLLSAPKQFRTAEASMATLGLQIDFGAPVDEIVINDILDWLIVNAPRAISGVQVVKLAQRVQHLQRFVYGQSSTETDAKSAITLQSIPHQQRGEVVKAWSNFKEDLTDSARQAVTAMQQSDGDDGSVTQEEEDPSSSSSPIPGFFSRLMTSIPILQNVITRNILMIPELFDAEAIKQEMEQSKGEDTDLAEGALEVRLAGFPTEVPYTQPLVSDGLTDKSEIAAGPKALFSGKLPEVGKVLIEYKYIGVQDTDARSRDRLRMERLVTAMRKAQSSSFRIPDCLGFLSDVVQEQVGIVFKSPGDSDRSILSLNWILQQHAEGKRHIEKPSLGEKYKLALSIGRALLQWHLTGWVHQSMFSANIVLFGNEVGHPEYLSPYLFGFEYAREQDASSWVRRANSDKMLDMYRHPDRQGSTPAKFYTKYHDIYSFGLLLIEIGLWSPLEKLTKQSWKYADYKEKILSQLDKGVLNQSMGRAFESAARICLTGSFGADEDDKNGTRLAAKFESQVLQQLALGIQVDGDQNL